MGTPAARGARRRHQGRRRAPVREPGRLGRRVLRRRHRRRGSRQAGSSVAGLEVIARGSSTEYRQTTKRPPEIARELGADYLLDGTVRWEKTAGRHEPGPGHARAGGRAPGQARPHPLGSSRSTPRSPTSSRCRPTSRARWSTRSDVALGDSARRELAAKPTENLAAYDEFLKGEAAVQGMKGDQASLRRAVGFYERAVALDSTFVQAWSQLSRRQDAPSIPTASRHPKLGRAGTARGERARRAQAERPLGLPGARRLLRRASIRSTTSGRSRQYEQGLAARARQRRPARRGRDGRSEPGPLGRCGGAARARCRC